MREKEYSPRIQAALKKPNRWRKRVVHTLACLTVFCTTYAMILPAITMERKPLCGLEEHTHSSKCYEQQLICPMAEGETHNHGEGCYQQDLVCPLAEGEAHTHGEGCYETRTVLTCQQEESADHTHGEDCYQWKKICPLEEDENHTHSEDCYQPELVCALAESAGHRHDESCYETRTDLVCPLAEGESHTHGEDCYQWKLICPLEEGIPHTHSEACYERVLICDMEEHTHTLECYSDSGADLENSEVWETTLPDGRTGIWAQDLIAVAESQLGYTESSRNYRVSGENCKGYTRYGAWCNHPYDDWSAMFVSFCLSYARIPDTAMPYDITCNDWVSRLSAAEKYLPAAYNLAHPGDLAFLDYNGDEVADRVGIVTNVDEVNGIDTIEGDAGDMVARRHYAWGEVRLLGFGVLPENPSPGAALQENSDDVIDDNIDNENDDIQVFTDETDTVSVRVEAPRGAFPKGTTMEVRTVAAEEVMDAISDAVDAEVVHVDAVEINFYHDGIVIEPELPIRVSMQPAEAKRGGSPVVVHVQDDGSAEQVDAMPSPDGEQGVQFETDSFSVYALVYTVDFQWEVNGKTYRFSLPGGGYVGLESLVELLGIAADNADGIEEIQANNVLTLSGVGISEATRRFVADVQNVAFSDPELLWVGKLACDTQVGVLKDYLKLDVQYSAELTDAQISEIDAQDIRSGDWAVICLKPFLSEESLIVTMKSGEVFTIRVTDAQISEKVLAADGNTYEITVSYGEDAQIPDGAELQVEEILPETEKYQLCLSEAAQKIGAEAGDIRFARFFDIEIVADGGKLEPAADVSVQIVLADAVPESLQVIHFSEEGPALIEEVKTAAEENGGAELSFLTDGFSTYGVICGPGPQSVNDLAGYSAKIGIGGRYLLSSMSGTGNPSRINKGSEQDAAEWTFEATGTPGVYNIYTMVDGQRKYMNFSYYSNNEANVTLSDESQGLTVTTSNNGTYQISWNDGNGHTYYLNEYGGSGGTTGFAGWYNQNDNNARLSFDFDPPAYTPGEKYMVLVKIGDQYYIVLNNGEMEPVELMEDGRVKVETPMFWTYDGSHFYHPAEAIGYDGNNLASDYFYRYIDPQQDNALAMDNPNNTEVESPGKVTERRLMESTQIVYDEDSHTITSVSDPSMQLKVVKKDGKYQIVGGDTPGTPAEVYLAKTYTSRLQLGAKYHTVNHIDISVEAVAGVNVPLAYGTYYYVDDNGDIKTLVVNANNNVTLSLSKNDIEITNDDIRKAQIIAYTKGENGEQIIEDDAFIVNGYSSNNANGSSSDQVRIAGVFKVADLDPVENGDGNNDSTVRQDRLNNRIYYSVSTTKDIEINMEYNGHQLYQSAEDAQASLESGYDVNNDENALKARSLVTLAASFDYWDPRNECPAVLWVNPADQWRQGYIFCNEDDSAGNTNSGMDFALGTSATGETNTMAIEITKYLLDKNGNLITPNQEIPFTFRIYQKAIDKNANPNPIDEVRNLDVDAYDETQTQPDYETGYTHLHDKTVKVGDGGMSIIFDYDVLPGMIYVEEVNGGDNLQSITDFNGKAWGYAYTYLETEYVWRNDGIEYRRHVSKQYSSEEEAYNSIPDVLGAYRDVDGIDRFNGFLEFYVYNVYDQKPTDIPVEKVWEHENGTAAEAPEGAVVTVTLGRFMLKEDPDNPVTGSLKINQQIIDLPENASFQATYRVVRNGITVKTGGYDPAMDGAEINGLPPGDYTVEIISSVTGHEVTNEPESQTFSITEGGITEKTFVSTVMEKQTAATVNVHVTNSINGVPNYQDNIYTFPGGQQIAVNFTRPGPGHGSFHVTVTIRENGQPIPYSPPPPEPGENSFTSVNQTLYFQLPSEGDYSIDFWHDWGQQDLWINSVSLYVDNAASSTAAGRRTVSLKASVLRDAATISQDKEPDLNNRDLFPESLIPGMIYVVDEDWSKTIVLSGNTWKRILEGLEAVDEFGNSYLYFIRNVHEEGVPAGTVLNIAMDENRIQISGGDDETLTVTNTIPNERPKIKIKKVDENGMPMTAVKFTISKDGGAEEEFEITSGDGIYTMDGLDPGSYVINETQWPDGYSQMPGSVTFEVGYDYTITVTHLPDGVVYDNYNLTFQVENRPNSTPGQLAVRKQWQDMYGNASTYNGTLDLQLVQWTRGEPQPHTVTVCFRCTGNGNGGVYFPGQITHITDRTATGTGDLKIIWDWNQWTTEQPFDIDGLLGATYTSVWTPDGVNYQGDGRGGRQTVTISNITRDLTIYILIRNSNYDGTNSSLIYQPQFLGQSSEDVPLEATGGTKTITLGDNGEWSKLFSLSGEGLLSDTSNPIPARYEGKDCYYTISEESVPEGYTLYQISTEKVREGVLTAYNRKTTIDIQLIKYDKNNSTIRLNGAEFTLKELDPYAFGNIDTRYLSGGRTETGTTAGEGENKGTLTFGGLSPGYYELRESKAPGGYQLDGDAAVYFRITKDGVELLRKDETYQAIDWIVISGTEMVTLQNTTLSVFNKPGMELPHTGGPGTAWLMLAGGLLTVGSIVFYGCGLRRRQKGGW